MIEIFLKNGETAEETHYLLKSGIQQWGIMLISRIWVVQNVSNVVNNHGNMTNIWLPIHIANEK